MSSRFKDKAFPIAERYRDLNDGLAAATRDRMDAQILSSYEDLVKKIETGWGDIAANKTLIPQQQRLLIAEELGDLIQVIRPDDRRYYEKLLRDAIRASDKLGTEYYSQVTAVLSPSADIKKALQATTGIPLDAFANQAEEGIKRLYRHGEENASKISAIIENALIQNQSVRKVVAAVEETAGVVRSRAETIAQTEIMSASNGGTLARAIKANANVMVISFKDEFVCPYCVARNMRVFRAEEVRMQFHPRCRCVLAPVFDEWLEPESGVFDQADFEFFEDYRQQGINILKTKTGKDPNFGPAPFDLNKTAPKPVWSPLAKEEVAVRFAAIAQSSQLPKPKAVKAPTKPREPARSEFPESLENLEEVKSLGGSTGAKLVRDPQTGQQFVLKEGANPDHLREEFLADELYRAMGVKVPKGKLYETARGPAKLTEFIDGESLGSVLARGNADEIQRAMRAIQKDFGADALLGNWDVIGLNSDNVLIDKAGQVYRIDNGGSLRFRAQGQAKGDRWNGYPTELWSLRNAGINQQTTQVFGGMTHDAVMGSVERAIKNRRRILSNLDDELKPIMAKRLDEMERMTRISRVMRADKWRQEYVDDFLRHSQGLRAEGIIDRLPRELRGRTQGDVRVFDEAGKLFDNLRGANSHVKALRQYMEAQGGAYDEIADWASAQAGDSWSGRAQAYKYFITRYGRELTQDDFWWKQGVGNARDRYQELVAAIGEAKFRQTFMTWHAWNYELIDAIDFARKNAVDQTVRLVRTENLQVMRMNNLAPGQSGVIMRRGPVESTSLYEVVNVYGTEIVVQDVPYHRILGTYFQERSPNRGGTLFLGDYENEFVAMLDGVPFTYVDPRDKKQYERLVTKD